MGSNDQSARVVRSAVEGGRRRLLGQLAFRDALLAATVALAGPAVLLVAGTDYFPLALLWLFSVAGLAVAANHWLRSRPAPYRVAQQIDSSWDSDDQISTAYHFLNILNKNSVLNQNLVVNQDSEGDSAQVLNQDRNKDAESQDWQQLQRRHASEVVASGDLREALPFKLPHISYALLSVTLLIALLFLVRYGTQPTLSLKAPLPRLILQALLGDKAQEELFIEENQPRPGDSDDAAPSLHDEKDAEPEETSDPEQIDPMESLPIAGDVGDEFAMPEVEGLSVEDEFGDELASDEGLGDEEGGEGPDETEGEDPSDMNDPSSEWNKESEGLMDKLKEAFDNMMSKLNMDEQAEGKPSGQGEESESEQASDAPGKGQEAAGSEARSEEGSQSESEGGQADAASDQISMEEGSSDPSEQKSETSISTAGTGEGSKELREAEQTEVMGELNELYQQRAEDITGEFMIETDSADQTAHTPYAARQSGHLDRGAALSRDEIPLAYRSYIKEYFKQVRQETEK